MKILVIPDVHLKTEIFDRADLIDSSLYDNIVCLGDLLDEWGQQGNKARYLETFERAFSFDAKHPEMLWCYGNHDLSYLYCFTESGFSYSLLSFNREYLLKMQEMFGDRLRVIHRVDNTLFSHAGLADEFIDSLYKRVPKKLDVLLHKINKLVAVRWDAKQLWSYFSPVWLRPCDVELDHPYCSYFDIFQVVGHTPVKFPKKINDLLVLDTFSLYSDLTPFGDQRLVIVDTVQHTFEYAE